MIEDIMREIRNYFDVSRYFGTFHIVNGKLQEKFADLRNNQYFRIIGSIENDGVYQSPKDDLIDETFDGAIWVLKIPKDFLKLCEEIEEFSKSDSQKPSPYVSESFGGYSYTKATSSSGAAVTWRDVFLNRLNKWRKI